MNPPSRTDDLDPADTLLVKADALIHRHRNLGAISDDDLPVLDDIVGEDLPVLDDIAALPEPGPATDGGAFPAHESPPGLPDLGDVQREFEIARGEWALERDALEQRLAALAAAHDEALDTLAAARADAQARDAQQAHEAELAAGHAQDTRMQVAEHLIEFDAFIAQTVEAWISNELPQIVASELDGMVERLRIKTLAHMRATLVPELSAKLSEVLDATLDDGSRQD